MLWRQAHWPAFLGKIEIKNLVIADFSQIGKAMANVWKLEDDLNDYVKNYLKSLGLEKTIDFNVESEMSDKKITVNSKEEISIDLTSVL